MALLIEAGQMTASDNVSTYPDLTLASKGASTDVNRRSIEPRIEAQKATSCRCLRPRARHERAWLPKSHLTVDGIGLIKPQDRGPIADNEDCRSKITLMHRRAKSTCEALGLLNTTDSRREL